MYQMMLKYLEVYKMMAFENIPTMPLELHSRIEITMKNTDDVTVLYILEDVAHIVPLSDCIWKVKELSIDSQLRDQE